MLMRLAAREPVYPTFHRYPEYYLILSKLDPLTNVQTLLAQFQSLDYLKEILHSVHSLTNRESDIRAKRIIPHLKSVLDYIDQTFSGPQGVTFLPAYYAILNMLKIYILCSPLHSQLNRNRWHGATYKAYAKNSHNLLTETVIIKPAGTIPLFYRLITGNTIYSDKKIKMSDIYPYIPDISAEYTLATNQNTPFCQVDYDGEKQNNTVNTAFIFKPLDDSNFDRRKIRLFKNSQQWKRRANTDNTYVGPSFQYNSQTINNQIRSLLNTFLFYHPTSRFVGEKIVTTPLSSKQILYPQELPITIMFFHLSSVVRYKPEFLAKLKDSRFWPVLVASRHHCMFRMMILLWSYLHQKTLLIEQ